MSQIPPPATGAPLPPYGAQPPAKSGNIAAVLSLICGILFCIPGLGILALIFGIVGISKANKPNGGGKGLAVAGLVLGIVGLIVTIIELALGGAGVAVWRYGKPARETTHQFIVDVAAGNQSAAMSDCTKDMDAAKVDALIVQVKEFGAFKDTTLPATSIESTNGVTTATLGGVATFDKGTQPVFAKLQKEGDTFKVADFTFATPSQKQ